MGIKVSDLDKRKELKRVPVREDGTMIWLVVRREARTKQGLPPAWWVQGIFTDEKQAVASCRHDRYFIGPLPLNMALPERTIEWVGAYCPLAGHKE